MRKEDGDGDYRGSKTEDPVGWRVFIFMRCILIPLLIPYHELNETPFWEATIISKLGIR
jgi:hypothetical protein